MIEVIKKYCKETDQRIPEMIGEIAICVFNSLGYSYKKAVANLEEIL
jgi:rhamnulokinase